MSSDFIVGVILVLTGAALGFAVGMRQGILENKGRVRCEAVSAGVAEWVISDECGAVEFRWKEVK